MRPRNSRLPQRELGPVLLYLPQDLTRAETAFARSLADRTDLQVLAGLTGNARADQGVVATLAAARARVHSPGRGRRALCRPGPQRLRLRRRGALRRTRGGPDACSPCPLTASPSCMPTGRHTRACFTNTSARRASRPTAPASARSTNGRSPGWCSDCSRRAAPASGAATCSGPWARSAHATSPASGSASPAGSGYRARQGWSPASTGTRGSRRTSTTQTATIEAEQQKDEPYESTIARAQRNHETAVALRQFMIELQEWFAAIAGPRTWEDLAAWARGLTHALIPLTTWPGCRWRSSTPRASSSAP